eukprot:COSAG02_NODE_2270_length_9267_cov_13.803992_11_plen_78_part_00
MGKFEACDAMQGSAAAVGAAALLSGRGKGAIEFYSGHHSSLTCSLACAPASPGEAARGTLAAGYGVRYGRRWSRARN